MARRLGALLDPAPPSSLALALAVLSAVLLALTPSTSASAATAAATKAHSEEAAGTTTTDGEAETAAGTTAQAEREARKAARRARKQAAESEGSETAAISTPGPSGESQAASPAGKHHGGIRHGAEKRAEKQAERAEKKAEKAAERTAGAGAGRANAKAGTEGNGNGNAVANTHGKARREREREQRRKQREVRGEREVRHETRREKEARENQGAGSNGSGEGAGSGTAATGSTAAATVISPTGALVTPPATTSSAAPKKPATRTGKGSSGSRRARRGGSAAAGGAALEGGLAGGAIPTASTTATSGGAKGGNGVGHGRSAGRHKAKAPQSSPLVTTVTRIIGVIPASLWIVIGGLGLIALLLALSSRLAARRAARLARQREVLLEDVGLLQTALLPELPERLGPVGTSAAYQPASGPAAGGDFYDVFALENGLLAVIVGDVSGHGREALPHTTLVRFTLRAYLEAGLSPRETLRAAAPVLERQLGGSFATVVVAAYEPRERRLTYACAGHPHPLLTGLEEGSAIIACSAPPIGAGRRTGTRQTVVSVPGASTLCFYTDGLIESRVNGELLGPGRLAEVLDELPPGEDAAALLRRVSALTDVRPDDMAAVLLEVRGAAESPAIEREELELDGHELSGSRPRRFLAAAGVADREAEAVLEQARHVVSEHGSALLQVRPRAEGATATIIQNNLAPLRARAISRSQEVAL